MNPPMRRPSVAERIADVTEVRQSAVDQVAVMVSKKSKSEQLWGDDQCKQLMNLIYSNNYHICTLPQMEMWETIAKTMNATAFRGGAHVKGPSYKRRFKICCATVTKIYALDSPGANLSAITEEKEWHTKTISILRDMEKRDTDAYDLNMPGRLWETPCLRWRKKSIVCTINQANITKILQPM